MINLNFKLWLEDWGEKVYHLSGEYWITNHGETMFADGDIGDYNHEAYVMMYIQGEIADKFGVYKPEFSDWEEVKREIVKEILDEEEDWQDLYNKEGEDAVILRKMLETDPQAKEKLIIANGMGDARSYAIMNWGWKRVAGNDIESRSLTSQDMQAIARGLAEIEERLAEDAEFTISVYGDKTYDVTFAELEAGRLYLDQPTPTPDTSFELSRRQKGKWLDYVTHNAKQQVRDREEMQYLHPYYQDKTFPFGDWNLNY